MPLELLLHHGLLPAGSVIAPAASRANADRHEGDGVIRIAKVKEA
jgi:hypothetical protein